MEASTFAEALIGDTSWIRPAQIKKSPALSKEVFSEKAQVIESLERFAQEKTTELQTTAFKIDGGGEVAIRPEQTWDGLKTYLSNDELEQSLSLDSSLLKIILNGKNKNGVKAIFVSEKFRTVKEIEPELKTGFINELIVGFPIKTAELFERMILAMKLTPDEVLIYPVEGSDETDFSGEVMSLAAYYKPEVIITLGAKATNKILKSSDRLSVIHGQFFTRKVTDHGSFQIVPLFHPSIIETNQNMKKTAWADMQKIMKHLKKIP